MRSSVVACAALATAAVWSTQTHALDFRITFNPAQPLVAQVEVVAPQRADKKGVARLVSKAPLAARGVQMGVGERVSNVRCDGAALKRNEAGWVMPPRGCARLTWSTAFVPLDGKDLAAQGIDAFEHTNGYHAASRAWLLSESVSLLRWEGSQGSRLVVRGAAPVLGGIGGVSSNARSSGRRGGDAAMTQVLPDAGDPPEFMIVGRAPQSTERAGNRDLTYVRFVAGDVVPLEKAHAQAVGYLAGITRAASDAPEFGPTLTVWLPVDDQAGGLGAAQGGTGELINVIVDGNGAVPARFPYALLVAVQSRLAQLWASTTPTWVSVSLAEYYARKAVARSTLDADARVQIEAAYPTADSAPPGTLPGLQFRVVNRDAEAYRALSQYGSTFWLQLDRAIQAHSGGKRSLDDELPEIVRSEYGSTRLPVALIERLRAAAGPAAFDALQTRYLGSMN